MLYYVAFIFLLIISYAIIGWLVEVIYYSFKNKRFTNRSLFMGPYILTFGLNTITLIAISNTIISMPIIIFLLGILICNIVVYILDCYMENILKTKWWDYSKEFLNLNGRICLKFSLIYGVISLLLVYLFNPFYMRFLVSLRYQTLYITSLIIAIIFIIDFIMSLILIARLKKSGKLKHLTNTEDIKKEIRKLLKRKRKS